MHEFSVFSFDMYPIFIFIFGKQRKSAKQRKVIKRRKFEKQSKFGSQRKAGNQRTVGSQKKLGKPKIKIFTGIKISKENTYSRWILKLYLILYF